MNMGIINCVRGRIEMTKDEWFSLPLDLRQRYWRDTDWGKRPCSDEMAAEIKAALEAPL